MSEQEELPPVSRRRVPGRIWVVDTRVMFEVALAPQAFGGAGKVLRQVGIEPPISSGVIDIFIYGLAPRRFAAASYLYFEAHGCETIAGILDGSFSFRVER